MNFRITCAQVAASQATVTITDVAPTLTLDEFMDLEGSMLPLAVQAEDFKEGTRAFKEKRAASFTGH